jgi:predicted permease
VVLQVALSLVLMSGAGVFIRSLRNLNQLDPGFEREKVLIFGIDTRRNGYTQEQSKLLVTRLLDRLSQLPGVTMASMADFSPLNMNTGNSIAVEGYQPRAVEPSEDPGVGTTMPGYFATMGVPLLGGRDFSLHDTTETPKVAIINEAFARHFYGTTNPVGRRLGFGKNVFDVEIVGLVKDMKVSGLREAPVRMLFLPALQRSVFGFGGGAIHVRTAVDPATLASQVRAEVRAIDPNLPLADVSTVRQHVDRAMMQDRLIARLSTLFSALALILSAVGIYGVMSYAVSRRTREIGIRMALGEAHSSIAKRILKEAGGLTLAGAAIGIPAAYAILRLVSGLLFGLTPADPVSAAAAIGVLGCTAFLAAWLPARRASRVDPMIALRHE